jgi:hypothetical protein
MTAATITLPEAQVIARGWQTWTRAKLITWPEAGSRAVAEALTDLHDALDFYVAILGEEIHPAAAFPVVVDDPEPLTEALRLAAADVETETAELIRMIAGACGEETAARVRGTDSGGSTND